METRQLGNSDLHLSTIGLGTWAIGGDNWKWTWGPQDDALSIQAIQRSLDQGINWIDTAPVYGFGHAEEIVGKAIKGRRDKTILATKCSWIWNHEKRELINSLNPESIRREVEASLKRMDIDVIDLYQMHGPHPEHEMEDAWICIGDLIQEGKLRYGGVSNFNLAQLQRLQAIRPITSSQPPYSMLSREIEQDNLPFCIEQNIGVLAYWPLQAGLLTGKFDHNRLNGLTKDDWRLGHKDFQEPRFSINLEFVEKLKVIAERNGKQLSHLAIAWVLHQPGVTSAIVGVRSPAQIDENIGGADWELSSEDLGLIRKLLDERDQKIATIS